jgi:hypothetical protein
MRTKTNQTKSSTRKPTTANNRTGPEPEQKQPTTQPPRHREEGKPPDVSALQSKRNEFMCPEFTKDAT